MGKPTGPLRLLDGPVTDLVAGFLPRNYLHHGNAKRTKTGPLSGSDVTPAVSAHMSTEYDP